MKYLKNLLIECDLNEVKSQILVLDKKYKTLKEAADVRYIFNEDVVNTNFPDIRSSLETVKNQYVAVKRGLEIIDRMPNSPKKESRRTKINSALESLKKKLSTIVSSINIEMHDIEGFNKKDVASSERNSISPIESSDLNRAV